MKISAIFVNFCYEIFAKTIINFCENTKTKNVRFNPSKDCKMGGGGQQGV
jgi:hypothetical protein